MPIRVAAICALGAIAAAPLCQAQDYPSRPVRIVTSSVGGGSDFISRLLAQGISGPLGQQVVVENRPSGIIIGETGAKAAPDGYTLIIFGNGLWVAPLLQPNVPYDPIGDFAPISVVTRQPNVLVVHPALPVKSVSDLIALAKARPGALNYAGGSSGSSVHLSAELFNSMAGIKTTRIPYKNVGVGYVDLMAGNVQFTFATTSVLPHIKSGKLRALGVTSPEPSAVLPGVPAVAEFLPGYQLDSIYGVLAPAKTPPAIIARLNREIVQFLSTPEAKARVLATGSEAVGSTPEQFAVRIKSEMTKMAKIIKDAGIKED